MCYCCDKPTSHLVIVWLMLIFYVVALILAIVELAGTPAIPSGWYIAGLIFCVIGIGICSLDIYGIQEKNIRYMVPFFVWMIFTTIIMGVLAVVYIIFLVQLKRYVREMEWDAKYFSETYDSFGALIGTSLAFFILFAYFCYVVFSHMKEVKAQEVLPVRQADVRTQPRRQSRVKY